MSEQLKDNTTPIDKVMVGVKYLLRGLPMRIGEHTYKLFSPGEEVVTPSITGVSEKYWLGQRMDSSTKGEVWVGVDLGFTQILDVLKSASEEDAINWVFGSVLQKPSNQGIRTKH